MRGLGCSTGKQRFDDNEYKAFGILLIGLKEKRYHHSPHGILLSTYAKDYYYINGVSVCEV